MFRSGRRRRRRQAEVLPRPVPRLSITGKNEDNEKIIKYLTEKREIEKKLVEEWIDRGDIYEEKKHHNVIFVGRDADGITFGSNKVVWWKGSCGHEWKTSLK